MKEELYLESYDNLNLKEVKKNFDYGDRCLLDYLEKFIPDHQNSELRKLYVDVSAYNEIYANGWTINELFKMGKEDEYWKKRARNFIKQYNVKETEYDEHCTFFDKYTELRDSLLDNLGIDIRLLEMDIDKIPEKGFMDGEIINSGNELDEEHSYTVGRILNMCHCVELHYYKGRATLEYGTKLAPDYWESDVEEIDWFNKKMSDDEIIEKLEQEFKEYFGEEEFILMTINDKEFIF